MTYPPLVAPLLGRCPHCAGVFKASIDLRGQPPRGRTVCPWCHRAVDLTA